MGYYTRHELEILEGENHEINYAAEIAIVSGYGDNFDDCIKWYDREKDMRAYSKKHPDTLFKVSGEGEESGDIWAEYYQNGLMYRCKAQIVFDDLDKSKME